MFNLKYAKPTISYCEDNPQWTNTLSNLAYFISAWLIYNFKHENSKKIARALFLVFLGSTFLHAADNSLGQFFDEIYMVNLLNVVIKNLTNDYFLKTIYPELNMVLFLAYFYFKIYNIFLIIFTIQVLTSLTLLSYGVYYRPNNLKDFYKVISLLTIGTISWLYEQNYCQKGSPVYLLHSLWHITSAFSVYYASKIIKN